MSETPEEEVLRSQATAEKILSAPLIIILAIKIGLSSLEVLHLEIKRVPSSRDC